MRAAIYVRVSSERQAGEDRVSIEVQLAECEAYCAQRGYEVVGRYVEREKYRVKGRLVQPSGQRKDRPQYASMLTAAEKGEFGVIVAWKEDRLYRGMYAAMPLAELLDEKGKWLDVELVRETFDRKMLGIKAALGKIEADNIRERMMMGRRARLAMGEVPGGNQVRYGYKKVERHLEIDEVEARWVRQVMEWYVAGSTPIHIRQKLMDGGAPTRRALKWSKATIENILTGEIYATGRAVFTLDGEAFEVECPAIVSEELWRKVQETRQRNKSEPRNRKEDFLCAGLVYCACGWKCHPKANAANRRRGYERVQGYYVCQRHDHTPESLPAGCMRSTGSQKVDNFVWGFIREICQRPEVVGVAVRQKLAWLESEALDLEIEIGRLAGQVDGLALERQRVITFARKGLITEDEMETQLMALRLQEMGVSRELEEKRRLAESRERQEFLSDWAARYLAEIRVWVETLSSDPASLHEVERRALFDELGAGRFAERFGNDELAMLKWAIFEEKRRTVRAMVEKVVVARDEESGRKIVVVLDLEVESLAYADQSPYAYDSLYREGSVKLTVSSDEITMPNE